MFARKLVVSILLAVACASPSLAAPWPASSKHATHNVRRISPDLELTTYHPESSYETFGLGIDHPHAKRAADDLEDAAVTFVHSRLSIQADAVAYHSGYSGDSAKHAYLKQRFNGIPVANAVANVAFNHDDKVVAFGSSFVKPSHVPSSTPSISLDAAIAKAESTLNGKYNEYPTTLEYVAKEDGSLALTHVAQIRNEAAGTWYEAFVDAHTGELVHVTDFVARASYYVLPITKQSPAEGFETLVDPADTTASPDGWHSDGTTSIKDGSTAGNNAVSFKSSQSSTTAQSSSGDVFNFPPNFSAQPTTTANINTARVNAFYIVNTIHDVSYKYGFTEAAFNFQNNNFGKGAKGNDRVTISVQAGGGTDNANFATPADGQSGSMQMYLWDYTTPGRDGAIENDIVSHENTHGITNRMTGGGTGRCLQSTEAGGMGEGWSDAMAEWLEQKSATVTDFTLGAWVTDDAAGIRSHPYSTSATINPLRYSSLKTLTEVHDIGEVWANILHNVYAGLVAAHGFSADAHTNPSGTGGNTVFLNLFISSLPIQPCSPTFLTARDAWIQADVNKFGGANKCTLWKSFASRGLGVNAKSHNDDTTVPAGC